MSSVRLVSNMPINYSSITLKVREVPECTDRLIHAPERVKWKPSTRRNGKDWHVEMIIFDCKIE